MPIKRTSTARSGNGLANSAFQYENGGGIHPHALEYLFSLLVDTNWTTQQHENYYTIYEHHPAEPPIILVQFFHHWPPYAWL